MVGKLQEMRTSPATGLNLDKKRNGGNGGSNKKGVMNTGFPISKGALSKQGRNRNTNVESGNSIFKRGKTDNNPAPNTTNTRTTNNSLMGKKYKEGDCKGTQEKRERQGFSFYRRQVSEPEIGRMGCE